jgi:cyclic pyranopterin monophosphate synthase
MAPDATPPPTSMIDVGGKEITRREATARGRICLATETVAAILGGRIVKGDVPATARLAGILAAKRTPEIVPLCHPLRLDHVEVDVVVEKDGVVVTVHVAAKERTGVEMEALTAVAAALLTVYDMCKSIDRSAEIGGICVIEKSGGRSGHYQREDV